MFKIFKLVLFFLFTQSIYPVKAHSNKTIPSNDTIFYNYTGDTVKCGILFEIYHKGNLKWKNSKRKISLPYEGQSPCYFFVDSSNMWKAYVLLDSFLTFGSKEIYGLCTSKNIERLKSWEPVGTKYGIQKCEMSSLNLTKPQKTMKSLKFYSIYQLNCLSRFSFFEISAEAFKQVKFLDFWYPEEMKPAKFINFILLDRITPNWSKVVVE